MSARSSIEGHVAVITGGAVGIGAACVDRFAREGARILLLDRDGAKGEEAAARVRAAGAEIVFVEGDAAVKADVEALFRRADAEWGRLDILVNCAGGFFENSAVEDIEAEEWDRIVAENLKSVYLCCREAVERMKPKGYGRIVNVASITGRTGVLQTSLPYGAAKAGMVGFTRRLAAELAAHGITANAVAPGLVLSPRVAKMHKDRLPEILEGIPMGRPGEAEEIADAVWYLSTPGASYVTGATLDVNGGHFIG